MRSALESTKYEQERFISDLRERHSVEVEELAEQNHDLQMRVEEARDQE